MTTQEVANQLINYCRQGRYDLAQSELYADNAVSIEPKGAPVELVEGLPAIQGKAQQWASMVEEMHSAEVSDAIVAGNHFTCTMKNDVTFKDRGRTQIEEVCVYEVNDGKIVKEQFFYPMS